MVLQFFLSKSFQRNKLMLHPSDSALKPVSIRGFTLPCTVELRFADTCLIRTPSLLQTVFFVSGERKPLFKIVANFTRLTAREIPYNNFEISLVVFMPNITTNHAITYTNLSIIFYSLRTAKNL